MHVFRSKFTVWVRAAIIIACGIIALCFAAEIATEIVSAYFTLNAPTETFKALRITALALILAVVTLMTLIGIILNAFLIIKTLVKVRVYNVDSWANHAYDAKMALRVVIRVRVIFQETKNVDTFTSCFLY